MYLLLKSFFFVLLSKFLCFLHVFKFTGFVMHFGFGMLNNRTFSKIWTNPLQNLGCSFLSSSFYLQVLSKFYKTLGFLLRKIEETNILLSMITVFLTSVVFLVSVMLPLKTLRQLVWRLLQRWKNALDWKKCPISMFSEISSPCKHVLAALFRK